MFKRLVKSKNEIKELSSFFVAISLIMPIAVPVFILIPPIFIGCLVVEIITGKQIIERDEAELAKSMFANNKGE